MGWAPSTGGSGRFSGILKPQSPPPPPLNLPVFLTAGCSAADSPFGCHSFDGGHRRASRALRPYGLRAETGSPRWSEASKESRRQPADRFADRMAGAPGAVLEADLGPTASPAQTARLRCPTAGRGVRGTQRGPLFDTKSFFVHFETIGNLAAP